MAAAQLLTSAVPLNIAPPSPPHRCSWDDGRPQSAKAREGSRAYDWIAGLFDGARKAAARSRDHLARFIAVKARRRGRRREEGASLRAC